MASATKWEIGQEVIVAPRTWPGINKPGGHGKIVEIHYSSVGIVDSLDVKYTLGGGTDTHLDVDLVEPHIELDRGRRSRRGRDFFTVEEPSPRVAAEGGNKENTKPSSSKATTTKKASKENDSTTDSQLLVQKKRKKQSKKTLPTTSSKDGEANETGPPQAAAALTTSTAAATKKKKQKKSAPKPEKIAPKPPRSSIPKYIDTSNSVLAQTVSPLTDSLFHHDTTPQQQQQQKSRTPTTISGDNTSATCSLGTSQAAEAFSTSKPNKVASASNKNTTTTKQQPSSSKQQEAPEKIAPERKTLKHVYDHQVQDANQYITNLVGNTAKKSNAQHQQQQQQPPKPEVPRFVKPEKTEAKAAEAKAAEEEKQRLAAEAKAAEEEKQRLAAEAAEEEKQRLAAEAKAAEEEKQRLEETRGHEFGKHFSNVMQQNDHCIPEDDLLEAINQCVVPSKQQRLPQANSSSIGGKPFTHEEAQRYVSQLCAQDKIMKSDGCLYAI